MTCLPQIVTFMVVQKGMEHKGEQDKLWFNSDSNMASAAVGKKAHHGMKQHWTVKKSNMYKRIATEF